MCIRESRDEVKECEEGVSSAKGKGRREVNFYKEEKRERKETKEQKKCVYAFQGLCSRR